MVILKNKKRMTFLHKPNQKLIEASKIMDTDLLWFYVRMYNLRVTDLMQGPVYGIKYKNNVK